MRRRVAACLFAFSAVAWSSACASDLDAPDAYTEPSVSAGGDSAGALGLDCDSFPEGAVGAEYDFTPQTPSEDDGTRTWTADTLPEGLTIDATTGRITGVPVAAGTADVEFTVMDSTGMAATTCPLVINDGLSVDIGLLVDDVPGCLRPGGDTLLDFIVDGTGDGRAIVCDHPGGTGNGRRPAGISVNPDTCAIEGTVTDDRFGNWVFIVRGSQSGAEVWVPYCVSNDDPSEYEITMAHTGLGQDGTLEPILRGFNPDASVAVGEAGDPLFSITDPDSCNGSCNYGWAFGINASPFDATTFAIVGDTTFPDEMNAPRIGFTHGISIDGDQVSEAFRARPWTVNVALDYCLSENEEQCSCTREEEDDPGSPCSDPDAGENARRVRENGNGNLDFSILMVPE